MLNTLKQLKHQHFLKQKTKRRAARIEKLRAAGVSIGDSTYVCPTADDSSRGSDWLRLLDQP